MTRRLTSFILCAALLLMLCGCGSLFDKDYSRETDYVSSGDAGSDGKSQVKNSYGLKQAILQLVETHAASGVITFGEYDGDISTDLSNVCWELRTQNALCVYCVDSIGYELNHIVSYEEATISIRYSRTQQETEQIVSVAYSTGIRDHLLAAVENLSGKVVLLVKNSALDEEGVKKLVTDIYMDDPTCAVKAPKATVYMYSGTGLERLFDVTLSYGGTASSLKYQKTRLDAAVSAAVDASKGDTEIHTALKICAYLVGHSKYTADSGASSAYDALVSCNADSCGLALAYKALCNQLGLQCEVVTGLKESADHNWNIIKLGDDYYHVDVSACRTDGYEAGFLRSDQDIWGVYKWDAAAYTECHGPLTYADAAG